MGHQVADRQALGQPGAVEEVGDTLVQGQSIAIDRSERRELGEDGADTADTNRSVGREATRIRVGAPTGVAHSLIVDDGDPLFGCADPPSGAGRS